MTNVRPSPLPTRNHRAPAGPGRRLCAGLLGGLAFATLLAAAPDQGRLDLSTATLVVPQDMTPTEKKAAQMLIEEAAHRGQVQWTADSALPGRDQPTVVLGRRTALVRSFPSLAPLLEAGDDRRAEGYRIVSLPPSTVIVAGNDARGVLFGAGRLLRQLDFGRESALLPRAIDLTSAPDYPLRGHQLGYRPKTNAYDAWDVATWEQYIRDLVIFGTNAIEGIPPRSDDDADSPHFPLPPIRMLAEQSRIAQEYGLEFWLWYPAMDEDYGDPATVAFALQEWGDVLRQLPYVTAVFVPGGDPGHTPPAKLFPLLEKQAAQLRQLHPGATMWMSPQSFDAAAMEDFFRLMQAEPAWLTGIVYGPQQRVGLEELRARVPARYRLRFYPDITHSLDCQFPVPDWDYAFQATEHREVINPRPRDQATIFRRMQPDAPDGFLTYSEGCNDDVNKFLWSGLGWDSAQDPADILRDYAHYFIGKELGADFARGLLALEGNWRGPAAANAGIDATLAQFQAMEQAASPAVLANWRFQSALYRAYYDAFVRARLIAETAQERRALTALRRADTTGSLAALTAAEQELAPPAVPPAAALRARVFELGEALFQSIRMQLSVPRYRAIAINRGANLDLIDTPLNNAQYLGEQFATIRRLPDEAERRRHITAVLDWSNPGPGGFYDNLGDPANHPHLVAGPAYAEDPSFLRGPFIGTGGGPRPALQALYPIRKQTNQPVRRISSSRYAQTVYDQPLELWYPDLDRTARYRLRVLYGLSPNNRPLRLVANDHFELHPYQRRPEGPDPVEFLLPPGATAGGDLRLTWTCAPGRGGHGRGLQIAEVWLERLPAEPAAARNGRP